MPSGGVPPARVLWLIKGLGPGGAERLVADVVPRLDRDRFEPEVAYLLPWKDHFVGHLHEAGIRVHCLNVRRHADLAWPRRLRRMIDGRFDVVHAHLPFAAIGARRAARRIPEARRPAIVYTEHNVWARYRRPTALANAWTFPMNDAVIAVSEAVREGMRPPPGMRWRRRPPIHVIENGVDAPALRANAFSRRDARAALGVPDGALVIGTVGGITPKKGHVHLVRAAPRVLEAHPNAVFVFVGLPAAAEPVRHEIERLGLQDSVRLLGARDDASETMTAYDVFCLPSLYEGLPMALLEALAVGVPAVASAVGGVPHVLAEGGGILVPAGDETALAHALLALARDPGRLQGLAAQAPSVAERFGLDRSVRAIEVVYDQVLAARR
ncbi:MAG: glycosyltransferase [Actinobacteria bacterium]|nr:glycosyltransferase [Actinomycetota bacterium]